MDAPEEAARGTDAIIIFKGFRQNPQLLTTVFENLAISHIPLLWKEGCHLL